VATYYVNSGAAGTNSGADWTNAYTAFGSAVTAATTNGDIIKVHKAHQENLSVDTIYTFGANVYVVSVDKDSSDAPTAMDVNGWIGNSSTNRGIILAGGKKVYFYGMTFRTAGGAADYISLTGTDGCHHEFDTCYLWHGITAVSGIRTGANDAQTYTKLRNCTFRFGGTGQYFEFAGTVDIVGGSISSNGSAITTIFKGNSSNDVTGARVNVEGMDLTGAATTATLVGDVTVNQLDVQLTRCKLPATFTALASQTVANCAGATLDMFDCSTGDTHGLIGRYTALGQCETNTSIYYTSGAAAQSWKIDTTAACSFATPFVTPWIDLYNTSTSAITPYFEVLRDGSATAYQNDEVWAEFSVKTTSGSVLPTLGTDRMTPLGSPADQASGAGLGSWAGESGTAWSGKCDSGSSMTPAENGHIRGRLIVGEPSITVYLDPQIRT